MPRVRAEWMPPDRPLVVAHRGSSEVHPEHTFAGYVQAIEEGADLLECDVRLTADGHLVCVHDRRIDRTSDGHGVVSAKTLHQLRRWDFGAGAVLRLEELVDLALAADRPVGLAIETKHPNRYAGLVEQRVVEAVRGFGLLPSRFETHSRVYFMSFAELALRRWRELAPGAPTVFLMERVPLRCRRGWLPFSARAAGPSVEILRAHPEYVRRVHRAGGRVFVWTADEPADIDLCRELRVDAVITNRPGVVREHLDRS
ncbi:MAG TPA: glycerophosphodiester phosphodiesterase family protein [Candidatus Nanopelagicales bacterium]|nr:glycerophosphodiester phosphodiesterase family protein [Candidatus Nanopelagicales bacterium]